MKRRQMLKVMEFDFTILGVRPPAGMSVRQADNRALVLVRKKRGDYAPAEIFGIIKTGEREFSLLRINSAITDEAKLFSNASVILRAEVLTPLLRVMGYKC